MHICVLHNRDHDVLLDDPGREAREDVVRVAAALAGALAVNSHRVEVIPVAHDILAFVHALRERQPDLVINLCESIAGDSRGEMAVPCLLEMLELPYTGSSPLTLGLALHKDKAKELLVARSIPTPQFRSIEHVEDLVTVDLPFPLIIKPCREDGSLGVDFDSVVHNGEEMGRTVATALRRFQQPVLIEQYIPGREIYVSLLGNTPRRALPLTEIQFGSFFDKRANILTYRAKWDTQSDEWAASPSVACRLDEALEARVISTAMAAFEALGCRDYGRVDIRLTSEGEPHVIDINPNCDLHPEAGFARAARSAGIEYSSLALRLVEVALERNHGNPTNRTARQATAGRPVGPSRNVLAGRGGLRARAYRSRATSR